MRQMTELMRRYSTNRRKFKFSPDKRFIKVYLDEKLNGFIWNNDVAIYVDGDKVIASEFFK